MPTTATTTATSSPRMPCPTCSAAIDLAGRRVGDGVTCPTCARHAVVLRSRVQGEVPPAMEQGGLAPDERREVADALKRIKMRRVGAARGHVELYPSWAVFVAGVQFYLAAVLAGQNLIALGEVRRGKTLQVVGVLAYLALGGGLLAVRVTLGDRVPQWAWATALATIPLAFAVGLTRAQHAPAESAREHGARQASLVLPLLVGVILAIAQAFAVYFLRLRIYGQHLL